jgi:hypothetical protein
MRQVATIHGAVLAIELATLGLKLDAFVRALERRYSPDQPRVPAGSPDGGEWTLGAGASNPLRPDGQRIRSAQGYGVNILEEPEATHIVSEHVGKSPAYLALRLQRMLVDAAQRGESGTGLSASSFPSLLAAQKLVNSTLSRNSETVAAVARGELPAAILDADFDTPTGYEQYAASEHAQSISRSTYDVRVVIRHDPSQSKGYAIVSAYPKNR